jgi:hypothetical protein
MRINSKKIKSQNMNLNKILKFNFSSSQSYHFQLFFLFYLIFNFFEFYRFLLLVTGSGGGAGW